MTAIEQMAHVDHEYTEQSLKLRKHKQRSSCVLATLELLKKWFPKSKDCRMYLVHRDFVLLMTLDGSNNVVETEFQFDSFIVFSTDKPMGGMVGEAIRTKKPQVCDEKNKILDGAVDIGISSGEVLYTSPLVSKDENGVQAVTCVLQWTTLAGDFTDQEDDDGSHFVVDDPVMQHLIAAFHATLGAWLDSLWKRKRRLVFTSKQRHRVQQFIGLDRDSMYALDINWYILMVQSIFRSSRVRIGQGVGRKTVGKYQKSIIQRLSLRKDDAPNPDDPAFQLAQARAAHDKSKVKERMEEMRKNNKKTVRTDKPVTAQENVILRDVRPSRSFLDTVGRMNLDQDNPDKDLMATHALKVRNEEKLKRENIDVLSPLSPKSKRKSPDEVQGAPGEIPSFSETIDDKESGEVWAPEDDDPDIDFHR